MKMIQSVLQDETVKSLNTPKQQTVKGGVRLTTAKIYSLDKGQSSPPRWKDTE